MKNSFFEQLALKLQEISETSALESWPIAPPHRKELLEQAQLKKDAYRPAAVMICCYPNEENQYSFPVIKRQNYKGIHAHQMGLPGGKPLPGDDTLWHTALRECEEELGIQASQVRYIGTLSEVYIPPSKFKVTPFVAQLESKPKFVLEQREVAQVYQLSLQTLREQVISYQQMQMADKLVRMPGFQLESQFIWGATAMMLYEFKEILKALKEGN